jgi:hypothetical protein
MLKRLGFYNLNIMTLYFIELIELIGLIIKIKDLIYDNVGSGSITLIIHRT